MHQWRKLQAAMNEEVLMTSVEVTFPDSLFAALRKAPHEVGREIRVAASIHWYQQGAISMERAAEFAGLTRPAFLAELARRHVDVFVVDEEDLARELRDA
jgi:predicted HTH domain antitoxin